MTVQRKKRLSDTSNRRFQIYHHRPEDIMLTAEDDLCVIENRTRYPKSVKSSDESPRLLVSGINNVKLGKRVQKGDWSGMDLYSVTLEERATCSPDCYIRADCYGNSMHLARRHKHGEAFEDALALELKQKSLKHPKGFVVRLHVLGDFYSVSYVERWNEWLEAFPQLHVFGYTHRHPWAERKEDIAIGSAIGFVKQMYPKRFRIRWSSEDSLPDGTTVIRRSWEGAIVPEGYICTTYMNSDASCATCAMCWSESSKNKTIVFPLHGPLKAKARSASRDRMPDSIKKRNQRKSARPRSNNNG